MLWAQSTTEDYIRTMGGGRWQQTYTTGTGQLGNVPSQTFAFVICQVLFVELSFVAVISDWSQFSRLYCTSTLAHFDFLCDFILLLKRRQNPRSRLMPRPFWLVDPREECCLRSQPKLTIRRGLNLDQHKSGSLLRNSPLQEVLTSVSIYQDHYLENHRCKRS